MARGRGKDQSDVRTRSREVSVNVSLHNQLMNLNPRGVGALWQQGQLSLAVATGSPCRPPRLELLDSMNSKAISTWDFLTKVGEHSLQ
jgi:hypothetical protein